MDLLTRIITGLNTLANVLGRFALAPVAMLPGWLSATLAAIISGVLLLVVYKYTSNQRAIKRVKDDIKANLLALKLFKESADVAVRAQGRIVLGAVWLFLFSLIPLFVMALPVLLLWGQLALWYQARPLHVGEEAVLTVTLPADSGTNPASIELEPSDGVKPTLGPVLIRSKHELCWNIQAKQAGYHRLVFHIGPQTCEKELAVGDGFMRVSKLRPARHWLDALLNPWEKPFDADSPIQSIDIDYPSRSSWTSGTDSWVFYWFAVSMVAGFCVRRPLNVNI
jgi:hypothetical protein